jgi:hypothetical protein
MCVLLLQESNHPDGHHHRHQQQEKQRQPSTMTTPTPMVMMVINKCKATRRFNILASEDTHSDYFRRSFALTATTQRRVRFSNTIKVGFVVVSSAAVAPLQDDDDDDDQQQGDDGQDENGCNNGSATSSSCSSSCSSSMSSSSHACSPSTLWYTSADLARFKADAAESVLRYRKGDRSEDLHGLEKPAATATTITAATTTTTIATLSAPTPAFAAAVAAGHDSVGTQERHCYQHHPSSPSTGAPKRVASPQNHPSARAA